MKQMFKNVLIAILLNVMAIVGFTYMSPVEAANVESDLKVSFRGKDGFVIGQVKNMSAVNYPCVRLMFYLTGDRKAGFFATEVRNIGPRSVVEYKQKLPRRSGFGFDSVSVCKKGTPVNPGGSGMSKIPKIVYFRVSPTTVKPGGTTMFFWEVKNAETIRLYEDNSELDGKTQLRNEKGWPLTMRGYYGSSQSKTTTYKLVAENQRGKRITKRVTVRVRDSQLRGTYTIQQKSTRRYMDAHEEGKDYSVVTRERQKNTTQSWILTPFGNNTYTIQQKSTRRYLDAHEEGKDHSVVTRGRQKNTTQAWILTPFGNNTYTIQQKSTRRFMDAHEKDKDYSVVTRDRQKNTTQQWIIKPL